MKIYRLLPCIIIACAITSRVEAAYIGTPPLLVTPSNAAGQVLGSTTPGNPPIPVIVQPQPLVSPVPTPPPLGVRPGARAHFTDAIGRTEVSVGDGSGLLAAFTPPRFSPGPEQTAQVVAQSPNPSLQCPFVSAISTTATNKQIAGIAGKRLHICSVFLLVAGAENVGIQEGTGTTCGTGATNLIGQGSSGSVAAAANGGFVVASDRITIPMQVTGDDLCIVKSASNNVSGFISYGIFP